MKKIIIFLLLVLMASNVSAQIGSPHQLEEKKIRVCLIMNYILCKYTEREDQRKRGDQIIDSLQKRFESPITKKEIKAIWRLIDQIGRTQKQMEIDEEKDRQTMKECFEELKKLEVALFKSKETRI